MKTNFLKLLLLTVVIFTASCDKDDNDVIPVVVEKQYKDLAAPQTGGQGQPVGGPFAKFSFSENAIVTNDNWDIAFRGTTIIVNGGSKIIATDAGEPARTGSGAVSVVSNIFASVTTFPASSTFKQDGSTTYAIPTGTDNGWYSYNSTTHIITPIAGKIFIVKTHDGKYAKFQILSYYKGAPTAPNYMTSESPYYTFNYAYQANSTTTF